MKLVEILARELTDWPYGAEHAYQDSGGCVYFSKGEAPSLFSKRNDWDVSPSGVIMVTCKEFGEEFAISEDQSESIITREMWQAERDKLKGEKKVSKPKANADGWIRHRGGKCPVDAGVKIEYRMRDGDVSTSFNDGASLRWDHRGTPGDIMAWRPHKPDHVSDEQLQVGIDAADRGETTPIDRVKARYGYPDHPESFKPGRQVFVTDDPRTMRDRIHAIDAASKEEESRHCAAMEAFDKERAELVAKLAAEGLALVERPAEIVLDMSDWRNWKVGDTLKVVEKGSHQFPLGEMVRLTGLFNYDGTCGKCDYLDGSDHWWISARMLEFHSRPTK